MNGQRTSRRGSARWLEGIAAVALIALATACPSPYKTTCSDSTECPTGYRCDPVQQLCVRIVDAGPLDAAGDDRSTADGQARDAQATDAQASDAQVTDAGQARDAIADSSVDRWSPVEILAFSADPASIEWGSPTTLHVLAANATSCRLDGVVVCVAAQCETGFYAGTTPLATHTYELVCEGPGGPVTAELEVQVTCSVPAIHTGSSDEVTSRSALESWFTGIEGCFVIHGDLIIADSTDIEDLTPLAGLVEVQGDLRIYHNSGLTSLDGLQSLQRVTDDFSIGKWVADASNHQGNENLASIEALSGLHEVGGGFQVDGYLTGPDSVLASLNGLQELRRIGGHFMVQYLAQLADISALRRLTTIGDNQNSSSHFLDFEVLPALTTMAPLSGVVFIGSELYIEYNSNLQTLGLNPDCDFGGPTFSIIHNPLLPTSEAQALANAWTAASPSAYHVTISGNAP